MSFCVLAAAMDRRRSARSVGIANGSERYHFREKLNPKSEESGWTGVGRYLDNNHTITPSSPRARSGGVFVCIDKLKTLNPKP